MRQFLLAGFDLELYQPEEYAMVYWYLDYLLDAQFGTQLQIRETLKQQTGATISSTSLAALACLRDTVRDSSTRTQAVRGVRWLSDGPPCADGQAFASWYLGPLGLFAAVDWWSFPHASCVRTAGRPDGERANRALGAGRPTEHTRPVGAAARNCGPLPTRHGPLRRAPPPFPALM